MLYSLVFRPVLYLYGDEVTGTTQMVLETTPFNCTPEARVSGV